MAKIWKRNKLNKRKKEDYMVKIQENNKRKNIEKKQIK
jgi:hypothetical protein